MEASSSQPVAEQAVASVNGAEQTPETAFSLELSEDQRDIRDWVHGFAERVVRPHAHEQEEAGSDPGHELVADRDRGSGDALEQDPQRGTTRNAS